MKIHVTTIPEFSLPVVGNVYSINGGYGRRAGHSMILMAITKNRLGLMLIIDKDGEPTGVTAYNMCIIEERTPIAFVRGLEELNLVMESL
jgi:hypothetical protein